MILLFYVYICWILRLNAHSRFLVHGFQEPMGAYSGHLYLLILEDLDRTVSYG